MQHFAAVKELFFGIKVHVSVTCLFRATCHLECVQAINCLLDISTIDCTYLYSPGPLWIPASLLNGLPWLNKVTYFAVKR